MIEPIPPRPYQFAGVALSPAIIETLAVELFQGKLVERQAIQDTIIGEHIARGGHPTRATNVSASVKRALGNMKEKGLVENPSLGFWRFLGDQPEIDSTDCETPITEAPIEPDVTAEATNFEEGIAELIVGSGAGAVYLYFLATYRLRAHENGETVWPCKIGRTDRDPLTRVLSQAGTALPERPHVALIIRTQYAAAWESALHSILTLRGQRIDDSPGSEWFLTSPEEVIKISKLIDPKLFR
jgi:hypothetical protein